MLFRTSTTITTTAGGAATVYLGSNIRGFIQSIKYAPGTIATGATLTLTGETTGIPIMAKANAGTSTVWYYPRAIQSTAFIGDASATINERIPIVNERIKVVVAAGGNAATGTIEVIFCST